MNNEELEKQITDILCQELEGGSYGINVPRYDKIKKATAAIIAAYRHLHPLEGEKALKWIELKEGCEMPEIDEFVLWRNENGNYFVREIDKDDNDWWNGNDGDPDAIELFGAGPKCTHWTRITGPEEIPSTTEGVNDKNK